MWYALIWVEVLALSLLAVSLVLSLSAASSPRWRQILWPALVGLVIIGFLGSLTIASGQFYFRNIMPTWLFGYMLSLCVVFVVGCELIMHFGLKKSTAGQTSAAGWPSRGLFLFFLSVLSLHVLTVLAIDQGVRFRIAGLHARGCARISMLLPPQIPDNRNAYVLYVKAAEQFRFPDPEQKQWGDWVYEVEKPDFDLATVNAEEIIEQNTSALDLLHKAGDMEDYYFESDYLSPSYEIPSLLDARNAANLLALSARHHAANNNPDAAMADISAIRAQAKHIGSTPIHISAMISVAISNIVNRTLENVLGSMHPNYEKLTDSSGQNFVDFNRILWRAFKMEEATTSNLMSLINEEGFSTFYSGFSELPAFDLIPSAYIRIFLMPPDIDYYLNRIHAMQKIVQKPYYKGKKDISSLYPQTPCGLFSGIIIPSLTRSKETTENASVLQLLCSTALGAVDFYKDNKKFPENLNKLVPKYLTIIPTDPFDGKPIKIKSVKNGLVLYSVGPNGKDDGGIQTEPGYHSGDITFYLGSAYKEQRLIPAVERRKKGARRRAKNRK